MIQNALPERPASVADRYIERISSACSRLERLTNQLGAEFNRLGYPPTPSTPSTASSVGKVSGYTGEAHNSPSLTLLAVCERLADELDMLEAVIQRSE